MPTDKLVIYAYYEKDGMYRDNLCFFLKQGLCDECDYIFVLNGKCSVYIPDRPNIRVLKRDNTHYDFGAWHYALLHPTTNIKNYEYFLFLNTSVRGPFLARYVKTKWHEAFTDLLVGDVKLVGTTINILNNPTSEHSQLFEKMSGLPRPHTHVQSQFFAMDCECLQFLLYNTDLFSNYDYNGMTEFIARKEIMMSQLVIKNGWNITAILPEYQDINFRQLKYDTDTSYMQTDPCWHRSCFGRTLHPYECIFIKTNRGISVDEINSMTRHVFSN